MSCRSVRKDGLYKFFSTPVAEYIKPEPYIEKGKKHLIYPSLGNRDYPHSSAWEKRPESAFECLMILGEFYNICFRVFRNAYSWSQSDFNKTSLSKLTRTYEETIEDHGKKTEEFGS